LYNCVQKHDVCLYIPEILQNMRELFKLNVCQLKKLLFIIQDDKILSLRAFFSVGTLIPLEKIIKFYRRV
jgi:hypothetical protein